MLGGASGHLCLDLTTGDGLINAPQVLGVMQQPTSPRRAGFRHDRLPQVMLNVEVAGASIHDGAKLKALLRRWRPSSVTWPRGIAGGTER